MPNQIFLANPEQTFRLTFVILAAVSVLFLKILSLRNAGLHSRNGLSGFWITPLLSVKSWEKSTPIRSISGWKLLVKALGSVLILWVVDPAIFAQVFDLRGWAMSYIVAMPVFIWATAGAGMLQILCLISGRLIPDCYNKVLYAQTLPEFWKSWNTWVHDGFKQLVFKPLAHRPMLASFAVFACSGLWHEFLINVPFLLIFRVNLVGSWMVYFFIQWIAIVVDQRYLKTKILWRRALLYVAVIAPLPLVFNEGLLRIFGWWQT